MQQSTPRKIAWDFLKARSKNEQQAIAASCPEHLKPLVRKHIELARERKR
jgi:hypothetical protein